MPVLDDIRADSMRRVEALRAAGREPWGTQFPCSAIADVAARLPAQAPQDQSARFGSARICGRVMARRDAGRNLIFLTVQDRSGTMQVCLWNGAMSAAELELLRGTIGLWDIVGFDGTLGFTRSGERTLWATSAAHMSVCLMPSTDRREGLVDQETRSRQRHLDLIANRESFDRAVARSRIIWNIRSMLAARGFLEVETPILQTNPNGATARPFETTVNALEMDVRLRIATEIHLKMLLVGGMERVFELGRIFRNEGVDTTHNPEFTSLELYQAGAGLDDMMAIMEELACSARPEANIQRAWPRHEFMGLIREHANIDPWNESAVRAAAVAAGAPAGVSWAAALDEVFSTYVQSRLTAPCFVMGHPIEMSPLCRARRGDARLAERFEAYADGMELANAYAELNDPVEQRRRLEAQGVIDEEFIAALEYGMPAAGGLGIGIDRLVMFLTGTRSIREVILFPLMRN